MPFFPTTANPKRTFKRIKDKPAGQGAPAPGALAPHGRPEPPMAGSRAPAAQGGSAVAPAPCPEEGVAGAPRARRACLVITVPD